jgi:hypothetical protein
MARITKTIQLVEGMDDDLIAWFNALPEGKGQQAIKAAIRAGIGGGGQTDGHQSGGGNLPSGGIDPAHFERLVKALEKMVGIAPDDKMAEAAPTIRISSNGHDRQKAEAVAPPVEREPEPDTADDLERATDNFLGAFG